MRNQCLYDGYTERGSKMPTDLPRGAAKGAVTDEATQKPVYFEATLNILGYREDGQWVALALEMDLRGYGETWNEALDDLRDLVLMQISFAHFKGQPEMIWRSAEDEYWERFRLAQRARLIEALSESFHEESAEFHAGGLAMPPPHVIAAQSGRFLPANG